MLSPRLITFDFGDTLVSSEPSYLGRIALYLTEMGHPRTEEQVKRAYHQADQGSAEALLERTPFSPEQFREAFGSRFFEGLGLADRAFEVGPPLTQKLIELRPRRVMIPGALEVLTKLHDAGYALAVISNNDGNTREKCESVGIADFFLFILDSTLEGIMKPDPRIFARALQLANLRAREALHVGDLLGCDVMGARAAEIPAVWLADPVVNPALPEGAYRISRMLELLNLLKP